MTAHKMTKTIERLASGLEELESQLELDTQEAISRFEDHCQDMREAYHGFPDHLRELKDDLGIEWHELKTQLEELEVRLALAQMETMDAFRERPERILKSLNAMENTMGKIELAEDDEGLFLCGDSIGRARKLEDKMRALDIYFTLSRNHAGEALDREEERVKKVAGKAARELSVLEKATARDLEMIGKGILKAPEYVWDFTKAFFQYEENEEERRRKRERDGEAPE